MAHASHPHRHSPSHPNFPAHYDDDVDVSSSDRKMGVLRPQSQSQLLHGHMASTHHQPTHRVFDADCKQPSTVLSHDNHLQQTDDSDDAPTQAVAMTSDGRYFEVNIPKHYAIENTLGGVRQQQPHTYPSHHPKDLEYAHRVSTHTTPDTSTRTSPLLTTTADVVESAQMDPAWSGSTTPNTHHSQYVSPQLVFSAKMNRSRESTEGMSCGNASMGEDEEAGGWLHQQPYDAAAPAFAYPSQTRKRRRGSNGSVATHETMMDLQDDMAGDSESFTRTSAAAAAYPLSHPSTLQPTHPFPTSLASSHRHKKQQHQQHLQDHQQQHHHAQFHLAHLHAAHRVQSAHIAHLEHLNEGLRTENERLVAMLVDVSAQINAQKAWTLQQQQQQGARRRHSLAATTTGMERDVGGRGGKMYGDVVKDQRGAAATLKSEDIIAPAAEYTFPHQPLIDAPTAAAKKPKRRYSRSTPATDLAIPFSGSIPLRDPCFPSAPGLTIASWNGVPVYQMACTRVVSVPVALPMPASANDTTTDTPTPPSTSPPQVPQTTTTTRTTTQVMRRQSDGWVNATHILKAAGVARATRLRVLERDLHNGPHEKVQGGYGKYQGTWVPVEIAHRLAEQNGILETLLPLLRAGGTDPTVGHGPVAAKTTPQPPTINVIAPSASTTPTSPTGRGDGLAVAGGV